MSDSDRPPGIAPPANGGEAHLVLARTADAGADAYCRNRLEAGGEPEVAPLTVMTDSEVGGSGCLAGGGRPKGVVVALDGDGPGRRCPDEDGEGSASTVVAAPEDLGSLGRTVDGYLTAWDDTGYRPVVCVDSLTGLLWEATIVEVYRFLYVLRRRIEAVDGEIHVHVNPAVHEEEIVRTFFAVFDRVVAFDDGGTQMV